MTQQPDAPVSITSARSGRSDDIQRRQIKYLASMAIRTVCFVLAVILPSPERWLMVAAAVFLPYVAVVMANAADGHRSGGDAEFVTHERPQLEAPAATTLGSSSDRPQSPGVE